MPQSDIIVRRIGLIPREPVLDFGTVEMSDTVSPQQFTVELAPDTQGVITTDVDWIAIEPTTFRKGQTEITVRLQSDRLHRGALLQGNMTAAITTPVHEQRYIPVRVKVRQFSEPEIQAMAEQLSATQGKTPAMQDHSRSQKWRHNTGNRKKRHTDKGMRTSGKQRKQYNCTVTERVFQWLN